MSGRVNTARWLKNQNRWQIKVQKDGVRKTFTSSKPGRAGQKEANNKADRWLATRVHDSRIFFGIVIDQYIAEKKIYLRPRTVYAYEKALNKHVRPLLGLRRFETITEQDFQDVLNQMYKDGYSLNTIKDVKIYMLQVLQFARKCGYTDKRFENLITRSKKQNKQKRVFSYDDIKVIMNDGTTVLYGRPAPEKYINLFRFMLLTGVRRGEAFGLKWSDITPDYIEIKRSITPQREISNPKTKNGRRLIPLNDLIRSVLAEIPRGSEYVFNDDDLSLSASAVDRRFKAYCHYHNLSADCLHELRHTFISLNLKTLTLTSIKAVVGHSGEFDTVKTYGHLLDDDLQRAGLAMNENFVNLIN